MKTFSSSEKFPFSILLIFCKNRMVGIDRLSDFDRQQRDAIITIVDPGA